MSSEGRAENMSTADDSTLARLVAAAIEEFHYQFENGGPRSDARHGSAWSDAIAMTHCICYGAAWRMLDFLRSLPVEERMAAMGMVPALSIPPIDCNDECMEGPCTCSGKFRVRAWGEPNDPIRPVGEGVRPTGKVDLK